MFKNLLRNQSGFSLIQGMILATAVAGMAYVGTKMTTDQKMLQRTADANSRVDQLHKIIYSVLQNKENCSRTFSKNGIIPIPLNTCVQTESAVFAQCTALGGSGGAIHLNGQGPCYIPGDPGPDTICIPFASTNVCNSYLLCHGVQSLTGTKNFVDGIWSGDSAAALFRINTNIGTTAFDPSVVYMNNSVSIVSMGLAYPPDLKTADATLKILYGKLDTKDMGSRSGKGYGGNRIAKDISIKIQRNPQTKAFDSCYAVTGSSNDTLHKDFCEQLGVTAATGDKLFSWDASSNTCKLNLKCANDEVFTGWDSNGNKLCKKLGSQMDLTALLAGGLSCDLRTVKNVKFTQSGGKIQIDCNTAGSTSCTVPCDCPVNNFCINNVCSPVPTPGTACSAPGCYRHYTNGFFACASGVWTSYTGIPPSCQQLRTAATVCPTSCSSSCDCPNSLDVCVSGYCTDRTSGCLDGEFAKGDASCQWKCQGGLWVCPVGASACGAKCLADGTPCDNDLFCTNKPCTQCCNVSKDVCASGGRNHGYCGTFGAPCAASGMCQY